MNDKFAADLRKHLVQTADERPAEGQLASVVRAVGGTSQRHPFVARLTWFPGRIGPLPAAPVRYGLVGVALLLAAMAGAALAGGGGRGPSTVFEGTWTSTDPGDGSVMILVVGPGDTPVVYFEDGYATGAACVDDPVKRFTARGTGTITGTRLEAEFPEGGGCGLVTVEVAISLDYQQSSDSLIDENGVGWNRVLASVVAPSSDPATDAPATDAPATDAPASAHPTPPLLTQTFTSAVHGISIDHPSGWTVTPATEPWPGDPADLDSADLLFDPAYDSRLVLQIASEPYGDLAPDEWRSQTLDGLCPGGMSFGSGDVDGVDSMLFSCQLSTGVRVDHGILIPAASRGYVIVFLDRGEGDRTDGYDDAWFRPMLESVDLRPEDAVNE